MRLVRMRQQRPRSLSPRFCLRQRQLGSRQRQQQRCPLRLLRSARRFCLRRQRRRPALHYPAPPPPCFVRLQPFPVRSQRQPCLSQPPFRWPRQRRRSSALLLRLLWHWSQRRRLFLRLLRRRRRCLPRKRHSVRRSARHFRHRSRFPLRCLRLQGRFRRLWRHRQQISPPRSRCSWRQSQRLLRWLRFWQQPPCWRQHPLHSQRQRSRRLWQPPHFLPQPARWQPRPFCSPRRRRRCPLPRKPCS